MRSLNKETDSMLEGDETVEKSKARQEDRHQVL
jgi:hypothetical protein